MTSELNLSKADTGHSSKVNLFNKLIAKHDQMQAENPFSDKCNTLNGVSTASK